MVKADKDFGKWIATTSINNTTFIKQFETGFIIKTKGELITQRNNFKRKTTYKDMAELINNTLFVIHKLSPTNNSKTKTEKD